ncbi:hypothetical protein TNCV_4895371 [Trichonephila clavipes]|nr:hypothetical protein TNCV_4895371 [Trichonephila clavipes]
MAYLGKGRREDLATELNLEFDKSFTIATLTDGEKQEEQKEKLLIEEQKEKLRIEEREENLRIEKQKEKLRIEEREEKLRIEQLRLDEQKRKDEFDLEKLRTKHNPS